MDKEQGKIDIKQYIAVLFFLALGAFFGWAIGKYIGKLDISSVGRIMSFFVMIILMYFAIFIQIVIHELGHLIFAFMTVYKFSSFRIMSLMLIKESGKIKLRRFSVAGTGGQVLMVPPDMKDGKFPVVLYNLGGSIMNTLTGLVFLFLHYRVLHMPRLSLFLMFLASSGIVLALLNGIPLRMGMMDNDGYNALTLTKNKESRRSFWLQLKINELLANGVRLKDMPDDWFEIPSDEEMKNSMRAVIGVFACNRLMDNHKFEEADKLMEHFMNIVSSIVALHKSILVCDRIYCELVGKNRKSVVDEMLDARKKKLMKAMSKLPNVIRTEYAYALLAEKDVNKALETRRKFDRYTKYYPYSVEVETELELIEIASRCYDLEEGHGA
ncbi:MAG: M50 family metallopeptidase [Clostridiaceae bacterium]|nr:M50 family metallopeptidase [Clostridiaceae bacterium]